MKQYVTRESLAQKTDEWLAQIAHVNPHRWGMRADRSALIVIDMQIYFLDENSPRFSAGGYAILPNVIKLIDAFRGANRPVIFTRHQHELTDLDSDVMQQWWGEVILAGSQPAEFHPEVEPAANELVITKRRYSAFFETDLEHDLRSEGISDLLICGVKTNLCCESTARDAYYRDFRVFLPADATGTSNEEMHLASLLNLAWGFASVGKTDQLIGSLSQEKAQPE